MNSKAGVWIWILSGMIPLVLEISLEQHLRAWISEGTAGWLDVQLSTCTEQFPQMTQSEETGHYINFQQYTKCSLKEAQKSSLMLLQYPAKRVYPLFFTPVLVRQVWALERHLPLTTH